MKIVGVREPHGSMAEVGHHGVIEITEGHTHGPGSWLPSVTIHYDTGRTMTYSQYLCGIMREPDHPIGEDHE